MSLQPVYEEATAKGKRLRTMTYSQPSMILSDYEHLLVVHAF